MTKPNTAPVSPADPSSPDWEPPWEREWVPMEGVVLMEDLQVRRRLDPAALARYAERTKAGSLPPPIRLARVPSGALWMVDGWHRWEAGALQISESYEHHGREVLAEVAAMSEAQARWQAARANGDHGVPLKKAELRGVFRAFIKAGMHRLPRGQVKSYRELEAALHVSYSTIRRWVQMDFPRLFRQMAGQEHGNCEATTPRATPPAEVLRREVLRSAEAMRAKLPELTPRGRWDVVQELQALLASARAHGVETPDMDF